MSPSEQLHAVPGLGEIFDLPFGWVLLACWAISPLSIILTTVLIEGRYFYRNEQWRGFFPGNIWLGAAIMFFVASFNYLDVWVGAEALMIANIAIFLATFMVSLISRKMELERKPDRRLSTEESKMPSKRLFDFVVFPFMLYLVVISWSASFLFTSWDGSDLSIWLKIAGFSCLTEWFRCFRDDAGVFKRPHKRTPRNDRRGKLKKTPAGRSWRSKWLDD